MTDSGPSLFSTLPLSVLSLIAALALTKRVGKTRWWATITIIPLLGPITFFLLYAYWRWVAGLYIKLGANPPMQGVIAPISAATDDQGLRSQVPFVPLGGPRSAGPGDTIVLVHGTFARHATWTHDDGPIAVAIKRRLPMVRVLQFSWSGANSPSARIKAGTDLAEFGKSQLTSEMCNVWLVAHSHGGNVALYGLRDPHFKSMVAGISFLGTPFFQLKRRSTERFSTIVTQISSWLILFPLYLPFGALVISNALGSYVGALAFAVFLWLGNSIICLSYIFFRPRLRRAVYQRLSAALLRLQERTLEWLRPPDPECQTFIAVTNYDEAGLLLRSVDTIANWPWLVFGLAARIVGTVTLSVIGFSFAEAYFFGDTVLNLDGSEFVWIVVVLMCFFVVLAPPFVAALVAFVRGVPIAFGYEGIFGPATLRITPTPMPSWYRPESGRRFEHFPKKGFRGLRHSSFYNDSNLIDACVGWMAGDKAPETHVSGQFTPLLRRREKYGLWLLQGLAAIAFVAMQAWGTTTQIQKLAAPKRDLSSPSSTFAAIEPTTVIYRIDDTVTKLEGNGLLRSVPAVVVKSNPDFVPGQLCLIGGDFTFGNWGTTINISVENTLDANFDETDFDLQAPNHSKINGDFIQRALHRNIWEWESKNGVAIAFRREFSNPFAKPAALWIRIWNDSSTPVLTKGTVKMVCRKSPR